MKTVILTFFILITLIECKGQNENEDNSKILTMNSIEGTLKKQLEEGAYQYAPDGSDVGKPAFSNEEMIAMVNLEENILKQKGYKFPDNEKKFGDKIKLYFGRKIIHDSDKQYLYINLKDRCDHSFVDFKSDGIYYNGFYIVKKKNIITDFYYLPELMSYEKSYSKLSKVEEAANKVIYNTRYNLEVEIQKWREVEDLEEQRFHNIQIIVARNKYLFNDSKADLVWLKANDKIFLESLVKIFGYVKDRELLEFVLKNNFKDKEALNSILWNQKCDGTAQVNKEVFDLVKTWDQQDLSVFSHNVLEVMLNLLKEMPEEKTANFSQQIKTLGLIAYYATKTDPDKYYSFFPLLSEPRFEEEFKKKNYYNIPDFREIYKETRYRGIGPAE